LGGGTWVRKNPERRSGRCRCRRFAPARGLFCLITVFLAETGADAEHQLNALKLVEPIGKRVRHFVTVGAADARGTACAKLLAGQCAVAMERAIAQRGTPLKILREKQGDGHAVTAIDAELGGKVLVLIAIDETQVDLFGVGVGDAGEERALLHAVAAPDAADDKHVHFADEAGDEIALGGGQCDRGGEIIPATLLFKCAGKDVRLVRERGGKFVGEKIGLQRKPPGLIDYCMVGEVGEIRMTNFE
jgi:hypothetical protein